MPTTITRPVVTTTSTTTSTTTTLPASPLAALYGTWDFTYSIISTFTDTYRLDTFGTTSNGTPAIFGTDLELGGSVGATAINDPAIPFHYLLVDPDLLICDTFVFDIVAPGRVEGNYIPFGAGCENTLGGIYPLVGLRR